MHIRVLNKRNMVIAHLCVGLVVGSSQVFAASDSTGTSAPTITWIKPEARSADTATTATTADGLDDKVLPDCKEGQTLTYKSKAWACVATPFSSDGCRLRTPSVTYPGMSYQQTKKKDSDGVERCVDSGTKYPHKKDEFSCPPVPLASAGTYRKQYQIVISINDVPTPISGCITDMSGSFAMQSTTVGCENTFDADIPNGRTYGTKQMYVLHRNAPREVGGCVRNPNEFYPHTETSNGWSDDDATKTSKPKTKITFTKNGQTYTVKDAYVKADAVPVAYTPTSIVNRASGSPYYEPALSCYQYSATTNKQAYTRPSGSTYEEEVGAGPVNGPIYACTESISTTVPKISEVYTYLTDHDRARCGSISYVSHFGLGRYRIEKTFSRADGRDMTELKLSEVVEWSKCENKHVCITYRAQGASNICASSTSDTTQINKWRIELGW